MIVFNVKAVAHSDEFTGDYYSTLQFLSDVQTFSAQCFGFAVHHSVLSNSAQLFSAINPRYTTCPAPNSRQTKSAANW